MCKVRDVRKVLFSKFGPHSKIQFENITRLRHEFLKTLARPEKANFCLKFSKNKQKLRKSSQVESRSGDVISIFYTRPKIPLEYGV